jgi:hypothetical protein
MAVPDRAVGISPLLYLVTVWISRLTDTTAALLNSTDRRARTSISEMAG